MQESSLEGETCAMAWSPRSCFSQGCVGWGLEQLGLVAGVPAHGGGLELGDLYGPSQTKPWFYGRLRWGRNLPLSPQPISLCSPAKVLSHRTDIGMSPQKGSSVPPNIPLNNPKNGSEFSCRKCDTMAQAEEEWRNPRHSALCL